MNIAMAQSKSFFGNRRGSTKSHTYQVNGGQQITKDRVDEVKNPRTNGQMVHRCCLHTLSDAHAFFRPYISQFWLGARSPQAALAAFRKANYPLLREAAENGVKSFMFSPYQQTTKPIGQFIFASVNSDIVCPTFTRKVNLNNRWGYSAGNAIYTGRTLKEVAAEYGLQPGDAIFFIAFGFFTDSLKTWCVLIKMQLSSNGDLILNNSNPGAHCTLSYLSLDKGLSVKRANNYFLSWEIDVNDDRRFSTARYYCSFVMRKVGSKTLIGQFKRYGAFSVPAAYQFINAIATYPQGGGNVLDGGPV